MPRPLSLIETRQIELDARKGVLSAIFQQYALGKFDTQQKLALDVFNQAVYEDATLDDKHIEMVESNMQAHFDTNIHLITTLSLATQRMYASYILLRGMELPGAAQQAQMALASVKKLISEKDHYVHQAMQATYLVAQGDQDRCNELLVTVGKASQTEAPEVRALPGGKFEIDTNVLMQTLDNIQADIAFAYQSAAEHTMKTIRENFAFIAGKTITNPAQAKAHWKRLGAPLGRHISQAETFLQYASAQITTARATGARWISSPANCHVN